MSGALKEVRERIKSVKSTQQITKAMKMVSAAKLRKAQQAITEMRPYADRLDKMLKNILSNLEGDAVTSFGVNREVQHLAIIVVTSNKGLCGAFNTNVIKAAKAQLEQYRGLLDRGQVTIIPVGKKGYETLKRTYPAANYVTDYVDLITRMSFDEVSAAAQVVMSSFVDSDYDKVVACYGKFRNAAVQEPQTVTFLPVDTTVIDPHLKQEPTASTDYLFEPGKVELLEKLVPSILQTTFQKFLLDTHASEHGARMTAMDNATENAEELLKDLKITYNKARQEAITKELAEIVGGAAALGG